MGATAGSGSATLDKWPVDPHFCESARNSAAAPRSSLIGPVCVAAVQGVGPSRAGDPAVRGGVMDECDVAWRVGGEPDPAGMLWEERRDEVAGTIASAIGRLRGPMVMSIASPVSPGMLPCASASIQIGLWASLKHRTLPALMVALVDGKRRAGETSEGGTKTSVMSK